MESLSPLRCRVTDFTITVETSTMPPLNDTLQLYYISVARSVLKLRLASVRLQIKSAISVGIAIAYFWKLSDNFPEKRQVTIERNCSKCLITCQRLSHKVQEWMNQTLRKSLMVALTRKLKFPKLYWRNLTNQRTCVWQQIQGCRINSIQDTSVFKMGGSR